jgi:putative glutathione S-transferase
MVCDTLQVYRCINNGVYRAGFATSQAGYEAAVGEMHHLMAALDTRLGQQRFLLGDRCRHTGVGVTS